MPNDVHPLLSNNVKELLEQAKPELLAIPANQIVHRTIGRDRVLSLTMVMYVSWQELQDRLDEELHEEKAKLRKGEIAGIRGRARVFYGADLSTLDLTADTNKLSADQLAATVKAFDRQLYKWAQPLFGDDPIKHATLRDISRGHGKRDDANDVLRLTKMFRENWSSAKGKTEITEEVLDEAEAAAHRQLELLSGEQLNAAKDLAARAYTAWYRDYVQLRRLGFYLFGHLPDAAQRFPGIGSYNARRSTEDLPAVKLEDLDDDAEQDPEEPHDQGDMHDEGAEQLEDADPDEGDVPDNDPGFVEEDEEAANHP